MNNLDLGIIGNCQVAALVDRHGRMVWWCVPRFDGDPFFCSLLGGDRSDEEGFFDIDLLGFQRAEQEYQKNTAVLATTLYDGHGGSIRVIDFAPRYYQYGRTFRPVMLARTVVPLTGSPRIRIRLRPRYGYGDVTPTTTFGSNHIRYVGPRFPVRLTTDASISAVLEESAFALNEPLHFLLGPDETLPESTPTAAHHMHRETVRYWHNWVRSLAIPFEWQSAVIRAAITLKLSAFEDTGAIVAAMTTSIPEAPHSGRNWDYRYCWLRDSYFVVHALNRLGATKTMAGYLRYIVNVATSTEPQEMLQPVYGISGQRQLTENTVSHLLGYRNMGPVRTGNQAFTQAQNDVYGAVVLAATQYFFDERLAEPGDPALFEQLEAMGDLAMRFYDQPDAGLWEYRGRRRVHTFSSAMCWAACDRLAKIAERLGESRRREVWRGHARDIRDVILRQAWDDGQNSFTESFGRPEVDASLLTLSELGFVEADDPRFGGTVRCVEQQLRRGKHLLRYNAADDFGQPETAFNACTFWFINALAATGREAEAREMFEHMLACRNHLGLLSEDIHPQTNEAWGNFPQTYSMAGIINAAVRLSRPWEQAF